MSIVTSNGRADGTPGVNLDAINVEAGVAEARTIGYTEPDLLMLVDYCLRRWAKGEEAMAERTAIGMGIGVTSWYRILAAAMAGASS